MTFFFFRFVLLRFLFSLFLVLSLLFGGFCEGLSVDAATSAYVYVCCADCLYVALR